MFSFTRVPFWVYTDFLPTATYTHVHVQPFYDPRSALVPFFGWEGVSTKIDYRKKVGTNLFQASKLEDLAFFSSRRVFCLPGRHLAGWADRFRGVRSHHEQQGRVGRKKKATGKNRANRAPCCRKTAGLLKRSPFCQPI